MFGWNTFKKRPWFFVATFLVYLGIELIIAGFQKAVPGPASFLLSIAVSVLLYAGIVKAYLKAHDDVTSARLEDLWNPEPFFRYLGVSVLMFIIVFAGLLLLIIPGVVLALMLCLAGIIAIERGMGPVASLKESYRATKGNLWKLFLFWIVIFVLAIIGMIPFGLGLIVVAPVAMLASIHAYRILSSHTETTVVVEEPDPSVPVAEAS